MKINEIQTLFDYNYWANKRILAAARNLTSEQFVEPSSVAPRNLRGTLVHALDVESSWRTRWQGGAGDVWLQDEDYPTVDALAQAWQQDEQEMRDYLATLDDDALDQPFGRPKHGVNVPFWQALVHVVIHGDQCRADAAILLSSYGHSPGDLDFLDFASEQHNTGN